MAVGSGGCLVGFAHMRDGGRGAARLQMRAGDGVMGPNLSGCTAHFSVLPCYKCQWEVVGVGGVLLRKEVNGGRWAAHLQYEQWRVWGQKPDSKRDRLVSGCTRASNGQGGSVRSKTPPAALSLEGGDLGVEQYEMWRRCAAYLPVYLQPLPTSRSSTLRPFPPSSPWRRRPMVGPKGRPRLLLVEWDER